MNLRTHKPQLPAGEVELPMGFTWCDTRVIHFLPEDTVDGWRFTISCNQSPVIEVIHRDREIARAIAFEEAANLWPLSFKGVKR